MRYGALIVLLVIVVGCNKTYELEIDSNKAKWFYFVYSDGLDLYIENTEKDSSILTSPFSLNLVLDTVIFSQDSILKTYYFNHSFKSQEYSILSKPLNLIGIIQKHDTIFIPLFGGIIYDSINNQDSFDYTFMKDKEAHFINMHQRQLQNTKGWIGDFWQKTIYCNNYRQK